MKNCRSNFHNAPGPIKRLNKYDSQQPFCPSSLNRAVELEDTGEKRGVDEAALSDASSDGIPRRDRLSFF